MENKYHSIQCPYGPHWHEPPNAEEAVLQCKKEIIEYYPYEILIQMGFTDSEIDSTRRFIR